MIKPILSAIVFAIAMAASVFDAFAQSPLHSISAETATGKMQWKIELASDPKSREKGLMFVKAMPAKSGMLFRFETNSPIAMWMKNTFIPLDMVFLTPTGKISHIHRNAVPQALDIIRSNGPAKFVLELNAGEASSTGLQTGQTMRHPWFSATNRK